MSDTTVRLPQGVADGVAAYVREVRAELADLPVEDVDDLIGGMEADLTELATESGGELAGRLGPPSLYADELRAAAGLPERGVGSGKKQRRPLRQAVARVRVGYATLTERHPWLRPVNAFLGAIRPAWWVLRGYLAAWAVWSMIGGTDGVRVRSLLEGILALAAIVISVQVGRGWLRQWAALRPLLVIANAVAVIVALIASVSGEVNSYPIDDYYGPPPGISLDGSQVVSIYTYDSAGNRINGVRLFDQDGRALTTDPPAPEMNGLPWAPPETIDPLTPTATSTALPTATPTQTPTPTSTAPSGTATLRPATPPSVSPTALSRPSPSVTRSGR